jgi:hypothetical protein
MFAKQNQNILSEHYANLVAEPASAAPAAGLLDDVPAARGGDDADDFLTLKRTDHGLESDSEGEALGPQAGEDITSAELSKRKLKMGTSKKAMLKAKGAGHKLVFDAEGVPHEIYEFVGEDEERARKTGDEQARFVEQQRREMEVIDVGDREVAKEKKREKKRKRKDREREVRHTLALLLDRSPLADPIARLPFRCCCQLEGAGGRENGDFDDSGSESEGEPMPGLDLTGLMSSSEDDGWEDADSDDDSDVEGEQPPAAKKQRQAAPSKPAAAPEKEEFEDEEALALRLLERS